MKTRILETLEKLAKGQHLMADDLIKELNLTKEQLETRSDALLRSILHNYSFFAVTTIDAFFQKIVRSFAREMGIQTGFKIELDQPKVIAEVIDAMLADMAEDKLLVRWLTDFAIYQINQGKSWDTRAEIKNLSYELFNEFLVLNKERVFEQFDQPNFVDNFISQIDKQRAELEQGMSTIGEKIGAILQHNGLTKEDFTFKSSGVGGYLEKIIDGQFSEPGKRVYDALEQGKWYAKGAESEIAVEGALSEGLADHLSDAIDYYLSHNREYQSLIQVIKYIYTFGLLSKISDEINDYREANDLLLISDFPVFLNQIINDSDAPYIYEKVGARYKHYLIDEFQDTSGLQWNNFKPLILDTLSAGNFSMVVGDIKQSIYRWRGGNWKILLDQIRKDIGEDYIQDQGLLTNRRSKQNIVEFNNDLFTKAPGLLESQLGSQLGEHIKGNLNVSSAYIDSQQQLFDESGDGYIDVQFYEKEDDLDQEDPYVMDLLVKKLQFLQDANYQLNDIAILVRTNPQGSQVAKSLMQYQMANANDGYKYDVISNESLYLKNNIAVHLLIQSLSSLENHGRSLEQAQLRHAYQQYTESLIDQSKESKSGVDIPYEALSGLGLMQIIEMLISHFSLLAQQKDHAYILAFQDLVLDYLKYDKDSLKDFLSWWQDNDTRSIQVSEDQAAMRIMTIHKSKGLQFKAVIVPYGQWRLDHSGSNEQLLWCKTDGSSVLNKVPFLPVRYKNDLASTIFAKEFYAEKADVYLDNLNLLYVATTRAEEALILMSQISKKNKAITHVGQLLFNYFENELLIGEQETSVTIGKLPEYSSYEKQDLNPVALASDTTIVAQDRIKLRRKSHILDEEVIESINYGQIIHWIFSLIQSKDDFKVSLQKAQIKFGLSDKEMSDIKTKLREIWEMPQISSWFDNTWKVKNESSILMTNGKLKRPDRVIVKDNQAIVIDYKTGLPTSTHLGQVKEYKNLLSEMGYDRVDGYLIYLSKPELIPV